MCERDLRSFDFSGEGVLPSGWPEAGGAFDAGELVFDIGAGITKPAPLLCPACWLTLDPAADPGSIPHPAAGGGGMPVIAPFFTNDTLLAVVRFLKFSGGRSAVPALGWWMAAALRRYLERLPLGPLPAPLLVPVPLHASRHASRGYNQAALLALEAGERLSLEVDSRVVERVRKTRSQSTLESGDRAENVKGAFRLSRKDIARDRDIILVDDLVTTGETARACAEAVFAGEPRSLAVLSAGRTRHALRGPSGGGGRGAE